MGTDLNLGQLNVTLRPDNYDMGTRQAYLAGLSNGSTARLVNGNFVLAAQDSDSIVYTIIDRLGSVLSRVDVGDTQSTNADVSALLNGGFVITSTVKKPSGPGSALEITDLNSSRAMISSRVDVRTQSYSDPSITILANGFLVVSAQVGASDHVSILYDGSSNRTLLDENSWFDGQGSGVAGAAAATS